MASAESVFLADQKRALRRAMGNARSGLTADERSRAAIALTARLVGLAELEATVGRAGCVAGYAAIRHEIDASGGLDEMRRKGARVALPRVSGDEAPTTKHEGAHRTEPRLRFYIAGPADLHTGRFGIPEPDIACPQIRASDVDVMLVPGLAFDARGNRLGFGGGYYDELLAGSFAQRPAFVVGVGYDFQVVDACPADDRDARVDCVVTDARVIRCRDGESPARTDVSATEDEKVEL